MSPKCNFVLIYYCLEMRINAINRFIEIYALPSAVEALDNSIVPFNKNNGGFSYG